MCAFSLKLYFQDVAEQLRCCKRKLFFCILCVIAGTVTGIVLFKVANCNFWYCNRCDFACKLVGGGFFEIFCAFLISAALCSVLLCLFCWWQWARFLCYVLLTVISLYFGANCAAIFSCAGMLGALYFLLVLCVGQIVNMLCCFLAVCLPHCRRTFREAVCDLFGIFLMQLVCAVIKVLIIFLLLRLITSAV